MVIFGRNRLRLRQRAPFPWTRSRRLSVLSAQVLKNAGRLRCPDPSSLLSINSSGCSRASFGGWPTFRFLKGWLPRAYPAWDLWILRMLARSCISVGTGEDEKEARRCMSPRLPTFAKTKAQRWATRPWCLRKRMVPSIMCVRENGSCWQARSTLGKFGWLRGVDLNHRPLGCLTKPSIMGCISCAAETTRYN